MKNLKLFSAFFLVCLLPLAKHASAQSASIKATTILKTDTSWDGKPIVYPSGKAEITVTVIEIAPD